MARRVDEPADITYRTGGTCEYLATGDRTGGGSGSTAGPSARRRPVRTPTSTAPISEQFYVLSGEVRLFDGGLGDRRPRGTSSTCPRAGARLPWRGGASMLLMFAPGGPREDYFETLARGEEMTEEQRAEFMLRHDTYWV